MMKYTRDYTKSPAMNLDNDKPMWILLQHDQSDDTMVVMCHWHRLPSPSEVLDMIAGEDTVNFRYVIALSPPFLRNAKEYYDQLPPSP